MGFYREDTTSSLTWGRISYGLEHKPWAWSVTTDGDMTLVGKLLLGPNGVDVLARVLDAEAVAALAAAASSAAAAAAGAAQAAATTGRAMRRYVARTLLGIGLGGGTTDIPVVWRAPMPSDAYEIEPSYPLPVGVSAILVLPGKTAAGCTLRVTAPGPLTLGTAVDITAWS